MATINVLDYGAVGDGKTDCTKAFNNAFAVTGLSGGSIYIPTGQYLLETGAVTVANTVTVYGDGMYNSVVLLPAGQSGFEVTTAEPVAFRDLAVRPSSNTAQTAGAGIVLGTSTNISQYARIENVLLDKQFVAISIVSAIAFDIRACIITNSAAYGISVSDLYNADYGDSSISDCFIAADSSIDSPTAGICYMSGGGLRISNNKILDAQVGVLHIPSAGASTSILTIEGNSLENQRQAGVIHDYSDSAALTFEGVVLSGNQFGVFKSGAGAIYVKPNASNPKWLSQYMAIGNIARITEDNGYFAQFQAGDTGMCASNLIYATSNASGFIIGQDVSNFQLLFTITRGSVTNSIDPQSGTIVQNASAS